MIVKINLIATAVVMLMCVACFAGVPSNDEFASANAVVTDILAPKMDEIKDGKAKPCDVADYAISLMGESETAAAKYLLANRAYSLYMKGGDYAKAVEAIGMMRSEIPDMPDDQLLKALSPAAKGVSASKTPEVFAILDELQGKVKGRAEISKLNVQLNKAKASERYAIYRKLGECYAVIGDWKNALANFAKCGDEIAKLAKSEIDGSAGFSKIAGQWWDASEDKGNRAAVSSAYRKHAVELYTKGLDDGSITGLTKKLAEQRIESANVNLEPIDTRKEQSRLYCVVDLSSGPSSKRYLVTYLDKPPLGGWGRTYKTTKMALRRIEPGEVMVQGKWKAKITKPYYIGVFEVTRKQWELVKGTLKEKREDLFPMSNCSYHMIRSDNWPDSATPRPDGSFMFLLQERTGLDFDLPTEAQWEMACRAGSNDRAPKDPIKVARIHENGHKLEKVGSYKPNEWGLFDTMGNVCEWCADREYWNQHKDGAVDPVGSRRSKHDAGNAMVKGGGYKVTADKVTFGKSVGWGRGNRADDVGFRICLNIIPWDGWKNPSTQK